MRLIPDYETLCLLNVEDLTEYLTEYRLTADYTTKEDIISSILTFSYQCIFRSAKVYYNCNDVVWVTAFDLRSCILTFNINDNIDMSLQFDIFVAYCKYITAFPNSIIEYAHMHDLYDITRSIISLYNVDIMSPITPRQQSLYKIFEISC